MQRPLTPRAWIALSFLAALAFVSGLVAATPAPTGIWAQLYSTDILVFANNLRNAGFPEAVVGVLISQEINTRFTQREKELQPSLDSVATLRTTWTLERREKLISLRKERNDLLRATLGIVPVDTAKTEFIPPPLAELDPAKREAVRMAFEDYKEMLAQLQTKTRGVLLAEDKEKLRYLLDERTADLERLLGRERALDYELYATGVLSMFQARLEVMQPTAQELRDLYQLRRKYNIDLEFQPGVVPTATRELRERNATAMAELEKSWPAERIMAYKRSIVPGYRNTYQLMLRLGKEPALADRIWNSFDDTMRKASEYSEQFRQQMTQQNRQPRTSPLDPSTFPNEVTKRLAQEHVTFVKQLLGDDGYEEYHRLNAQFLDIMSRGGTVRLAPAMWFY